MLQGTVDIWRGTASDSVTELGVTVHTPKGQEQPPILKKPIKTAEVIEKGGKGHLFNMVTLERGIERSSEPLCLT